MPVGCVPYRRLWKDGKEAACTQHELPSLRMEEKTSPLASLAEDAEYIYAQGEGFSYAFSKQYGTFVSLKVEGEEQITSPMRLSAWRAPTDNDAKIRIFWDRETTWQGENIDATFTKVYDCRIQDGRIVVHGSLAGVSRCAGFASHAFRGNPYGWSHPPLPGGESPGGRRMAAPPGLRIYHAGAERRLFLFWTRSVGELLRHEPLRAGRMV